MLKRTLYFGNPAYLKTRNEQIVVQLPASPRPSPEGEGENREEVRYEEKTIPIEDTGVVILDHQQVTISQALLAKLMDNNVAVISCDNTHHPTGLFLPLSGHTLQAARFKTQLNASEPLKKQLWQQTIQCKITNQAALLDQYQIPNKNMRQWAKEVRSGDPDNYEARAAAFYWKNIFGSNAGRESERAENDEWGEEENGETFSPLSEGRGAGGEAHFLRHRFGEPPNNMLNYAYAILRAITARALVGSGLLPTLGIHHRNQYNAYCLADDIMEPYRPFADALVRGILENESPLFTMDTALKKQLLSLPTVDVEVEGKRSPLMVAMTTTTASLNSCFEKKRKDIIYPCFPIPEY